MDGHTGWRTDCFALERLTRRGSCSGRERCCAAVHQTDKTTRSSANNQWHELHTGRDPHTDNKIEIGNDLQQKGKHGVTSDIANRMVAFGRARSKKDRGDG